ncbi:MAG: SPL family radical SAM protein [Thermacetogeniaceae bacterium]
MTKSDLILRDIDILRDVSDIEIGFTITTTDRATARLLEPGAVEPRRRFYALARLAEAGLRTWVFIAPVIPGVTDSERNLELILGEAARAGVGRVEYDPLNFYPTAVANLRYLIHKHWPRSLLRFQAAYRDQKAYREWLRNLAKELWPVYGY